MFVTIVDKRVFVRLSRRNLRQLDAMLDPRDAGNRCLARKDKNGVFLVVQVEEDADHYDGRNPGPELGMVCLLSGPENSIASVAREPLRPCAG